MNFSNDLLENINKLHTTELGIIRIRKNLNLDTDDVVQWCKNKITDSNALIIKKGKNYYIFIYNYKITVNGSSYTIITAHKENNC